MSACLLCSVTMPAEAQPWTLCSECSDALYEAGATWPPIGSETLRRDVREMLAWCAARVQHFARGVEDPSTMRPWDYVEPRTVLRGQLRFTVYVDLVVKDETPP